MDGPSGIWCSLTPSLAQFISKDHHPIPSGGTAALSTHRAGSAGGRAQLIPFISETTAARRRLIRCFAFAVQEQDWCFWPSQAAKQRFDTSFCLLPSHPQTCERAGRFHELWPAEWRSQSLLSSCVFREILLRTQNLLTSLGCCQTSVLNRRWRIHSRAEPCQEIHGRPSVFVLPTHSNACFLSNPPCIGCVPSWHIKRKMKRERREIFPYSSVFPGHRQ